MFQTLNALRFLDNSKNPIIEKVFNTVSDLSSNIEHCIQRSTINKGSYTEQNHRNSDIYLDYNKDKKGTDFKDVGINYIELIGHELKHSYDMQFFKSPSNDSPPKVIEEYEFKTVNFENLIRKEEKRSLRKRYNKIIPNNLINEILIWN